MIGARALVVFASAIVLLAGCAAVPEVVRAPRQEASADANRHARELYSRGDFVEALKQAQHACELAASIEDEDDLAASLLNLSVIRQRLDQPAEARAAVDRILVDGGLHFSAHRIAEAALRRAVLAVDDGDAIRADSLLTQAMDVCGAGCTLRGHIANVRAQLAIEAGRLDEAIALADGALVDNRASSDEEEAANALRLGANARILAGRHDEATARLNEALTIDKRLGASRKIYRDLLLLGIAAQKRDDKNTAKLFFHRALEVARADGYAAGVAEASGMKLQ